MPFTLDYEPKVESKSCFLKATPVLTKTKFADNFNLNLENIEYNDNKDLEFFNIN